MRTAIITSRLTGVAVKCHATTEHPDSHHGCAVWVDALGRAYCEVDKPSPYYDVCEDVEGDPRVVIGQRIAELRKEQGMSQAELADKCGMQRPHIARVESGRYGITLDVLARIAQALNARIEIENPVNTMHSKVLDMIHKDTGRPLKVQFAGYYGSFAMYREIGTPNLYIKQDLTY